MVTFRELNIGDVFYPRLAERRNDIENFNSMRLKKIHCLGVCEIVSIGNARSKYGKVLKEGDRTVLYPYSRVQPCVNEEDK